MLRGLNLENFFDAFEIISMLGVLPNELNKLLNIVVVLSMALTPYLNQLGRRASDFLDEKLDPGEKIAEDVNFDVSESIVIIGFGQMGQVLVNFLSTPLVSGGGVTTRVMEAEVGIQVMEAEVALVRVTEAAMDGEESEKGAEARRDSTELHHHLLRDRLLSASMRP